MLEAYREEGLDDLRAALRPASCQSSSSLDENNTYRAERKIVLISLLGCECCEMLKSSKIV